MRKIFKALTQEQKSRGVIFSSTFSNSKSNEMLNDNMHEVFSDGRNGNKIEYLKDISFFKNGSPWKYCIERK